MECDRAYLARASSLPSDDDTWRLERIAVRSARDCDPSLRNEVLPMSPEWTEVKWSGRLDSNQRPPAPKAGALPGCATPRPTLPSYRTSSTQPRAARLTPSPPRPPRATAPGRHDGKAWSDTGRCERAG